MQETTSYASGEFVVGQVFNSKSTRLHNEMDIREGKTKIKCGLCKQQGHNRRSCKSRNQL